MFVKAKKPKGYKKVKKYRPPRKCGNGDMIF